jgi:hypothetical protein
MGALDDLVSLIPPPQRARIDVDWETVEAGVGTVLPGDYKALVEIYGPGSFGDFLFVFQPVTPFLTVELAYQARRGEEILDHLRDVGQESIPFGRGELMAIAGTDNGDTLYWVRRPQDQPDAWTITGNEARNTTWPQFSGGLASFLHAVMSRALRFPIFPKDFPGPRPPTFRPSEPPDQRRISALRAQGLYRDL